MWRHRLTPLAVFAVAAALASRAAAFDRDMELGRFVTGPLGSLHLEVGDGLQGVVPGESAFAPVLRELRVAPPGDPGGLLYFTPSMTIGGANLSLGVGYGTMSPFPSGDIGTTRLGGEVGFGALRFGGSYEQGHGALLGDLGGRQRGFDVGASYDIGNFTTGLTWSRGVYRDFFAGSSGTATQDELSLSLSYRLGKGIDLIGTLQYDQSDSASGPDSAGSFVFGTAIRF
ncbi:MAG: porin [Rhodospirillales bacterium]|nr:porin [Rhodospirillales bacterium]